MGKAIAAAAVLWPIVLGAATWQRAAGEGPARHTAAAVVYYAASHVCHQQPARSFHAGGVPLPVCGRCAGLYLAGALGALAALCGVARRTTVDPRLLLAAAAVPTVLTLALEWFALAPVSNAARFLSALPLGAAVAFVVVRIAAGPVRAIGYTGGS
jgi:uncharacterized membrane protein